MLPTLIVLESVLRFDQLSPALAAAALHGTALLGAFTAARARLERLAGIALAAAMAGSLGLIARPEAIPICAYGALLEVVASRELVRRRAWSVMRPLVMLPAAFFLAAALLYAGKREPYADVLPHVGVAVLGTWLVVFGYHLRILGKVASPAPGWLPFFSLWAMGLGAFLAPAATSWAALGGAAVVAVVAMVVVRRGRLGPAVVGLAAASIFLVGGVAIAVPGRGLLLAVWVGILSLLVLIGRIVFMDLFTLQGVPLLLSIVTLGAASGIASMALRHRE